MIKDNETFAQRPYYDSQIAQVSKNNPNGLKCSIKPKITQFNAK